MNWSLIIAQFFVALCIEVAALWFGYTYKELIPPPNNVEDAGERLVYAVHCLFPMGTVLIWAITMVMFRRSNPAVYDPLAGNEHLIQVHKNIATNTVEQLLVSAILMLVFAAQTTCSDMMKVLPLFSALFVLGRLLFMYGYRIAAKYRTIGIALNILINSTMFYFICYTYYTNWITNSTTVKTEL